MLPRAIRASRIASRSLHLPARRLAWHRSFATPAEPPRRDESKPDDKGKEKEKDDGVSEDRKGEKQSKDDLPATLEGFFQRYHQQVKNMHEEAMKRGEPDTKRQGQRESPPPGGSGGGGWGVVT